MSTHNIGFYEDLTKIIFKLFKCCYTLAKDRAVTAAEMTQDIILVISNRSDL